MGERRPFAREFTGSEVSARLLLQAQRLVQSFPDLGIIHVGQLAPVEEPLIITGDPVDGLFLEEAVIAARGLPDTIHVENRLAPCLSQDSEGEIPL